jgi:hypothetical protein
MNYWQAQSTTQLPREQPFIANYPAALTEASFWVDVTPNNPYDYIVRAHTGWTAYGDSSEIRLRNHANPPNAHAIAMEYLESKETAAAIYHEIHQSFDGRVRKFVKLTVPVADVSGRVTRLFVAPRLISNSHAWMFAAAPSGHHSEAIS